MAEKQKQDQKTGYVIISKDRKGNVKVEVNPCPKDSAEYHFMLSLNDKMNKSIIYAQGNLSKHQVTIVYKAKIDEKPYDEVKDKVHSLIYKLAQTHNGSKSKKGKTLDDFMRTSGMFREQTELEKLESTLEKAITSEDFETAAKIRDIKN